MVVVAVLGILATLTVPRILGVRTDANNAVREADQKVVQNALELYIAKTGTTPANITQVNKIAGATTLHADLSPLRTMLEVDNQFLKADTILNLHKKYNIALTNGNIILTE